VPVDSYVLVLVCWSRAWRVCRSVWPGARLWSSPSPPSLVWWRGVVANTLFPIDV